MPTLAAIKTPVDQELNSLDFTTQETLHLLRAAANKLNAGKARLLALDAATLTDTLNALGAETFGLHCEVHAQLGESINFAATSAGLQTLVDVRPFAVALTESGKTYAFTDGVFTVTDIPVIQETTEPTEIQEDQE